MQRFILAIVALLFSAAAHAHVLGVPYPDVSNLQDVREAAFKSFQTYVSGPPQISYNIVTDGGAACAGGQQQVTVTASFTAGAPGGGNIVVNSNTFVPGDVGKYVIIPSANLGNNYRTIASVGVWNGTTQTITLSGFVFATVSNASTSITYGFDDAPNFKTFNTWARANQGSSNQVVLTIPNGSTCWFGSSQSITGNLNNSYFAGINNLVVEGTGATISATLGSGFYLAGNGVTEIGLTNANGKSARLKSVSAAASTIELTATSYAAGYISRFAVGNWLMISGMDIQTGWQSNYGVPPNHQYFERRQITSICNNTGSCTGTATITLDRPLINSYLDTWPEWYNGSAGGIDQGGPATAYILPDSWNTTVEWRGVTIDAGQTYAWGRNVAFRNVTWLGCCGTVPTQNETFTAINSTYGGGGGWEVDKLIDTVTITGGSFTRIDFQSSSVNNLTMSNATIGSMFGNPKNSQITDSAIGTFRPGAWTNGNSAGALVCTRCAVTTMQWADQGLVQTYGAAYSKSAGVVTTLNTDETGGNGPPHRVFVPGGNVYYRVGTSLSKIGLFQSTTITQDPTNTFTATSDAGGFPTYAGYAGQLETHPAPRFTCDDCTGMESFVATNTQAGCPALEPLGECSSWQNVTFSVPFSIRGTMQVVGKISTLTIDVKTAATAAGNVFLYTTGGGSGVTTVKQSTWTSFVWNVQINAKQTGKRVYTYPTGWTCNGVAAPTGCAGDNLGTDPPEQVWIGSGLDFGTANTFSTSPIIDISATTNQGVVP